MSSVCRRAQRDAGSAHDSGDRGAAPLVIVLAIPGARVLELALSSTAGWLGTAATVTLYRIRLATHGVQRP